MNIVVARVFWREFLRGTGAFGLGRFFGVARSHTSQDFLALTGLAAIVMALIAFSLSAGRGISDNLANALLGHVQGAGVPIWVNAHPDSGFAIGPDFSQRSLDPPQQDKRQDLGTFYPVTELEPQDFAIHIPGDASWQRISTHNFNEVDIRGWALSRANPLWQQYATPSNIAADEILTVIASRNLFEAHFDYAAYRAAVIAAVPGPVARELPVSIASLDELSNLYFSLPFHQHKRRLVAFHVRWVESLPALQKISFIVPEEIVTLASAVRTNSALAMLFDHEKSADDDSYQAAEGISIRGLSLPASKKRIAELGGNAVFDRLSECIGQVKNKTKRGSTLVFEFAGPVPTASINACLDEVGLPDFPNLMINFTAYPALNAEGALLRVACEGLAIRLRFLPDGSPCQKGMTAYFPDPHVRSGLFYVPDGDDIAAFLDRIIQARDDGGSRVFRIGENYLDALARMDFTGKVIAYLTASVALLGGALVLAVLYLQIQPMAARRAPAYGLLLARGMTPGQIRGGFLLQITLSIIAGALGALLLNCTLSLAIEHWFQGSSAAEAARRGIGLLQVRLIPLPADSFTPLGLWIGGIFKSLAIAFGTVLLAAFAVALLILFRLALKAGSLPVELMSGTISQTPKQEKTI